MKVTTTTSLIAVLYAGMLAGCGGGKLETGYAPRKLNSSEAERRGYYAAPFTREAREATQEQKYDANPPSRLGQ